MKKYYINIGTSKSCCFVCMSNRLLNQSRAFPLLYEAVEEALVSYRNGYYSIGIIIWYELLKSILHANSKKDKSKRNIPAHDILKERPTKKSYEELLDKFKTEAKKCYFKELAKSQNREAFNKKLEDNWVKFIKEVHSARFYKYGI